MSEIIERTTEQAIMEAAEELFLENGYARTSTTAIAKKAGCNQALVHYYYRSKENLFGLVFRKKISVFLSFFLQVSTEDLPFEEKLFKRIAAHFEMLRANERLPVMFFNEIATNGELARKLLENFSDLPLPVIRQLQSELDAEYAAGRICKRQATDLIYNIFSLNIMAFLTKPLVQMFTQSTNEVMERLLDERKASNIQTIMQSLKPPTRMKRTLLLLLLTTGLVQALSAQLTIDDLQEKARQNYPQIKQFDLISKSAEYNLSNASSANLPQISLSGRATLQSDAINLSLNLPSGAVSIKQDKDQYQAVAEINQVLWDGGVVAARKQSIKSNAEFEKQKLEVDLYTLRDRVNQLFFGIMMLKEQQIQADILQQELQTNLEKIKACLKNGVANQSDVDALSVELLNVDQRQTELKSAETNYRDMLSAMTGVKMDANTVLIKPLNALPGDKLSLKRPEIGLFDAQLHLLDNQTQLEQTAIMPKFGLFLQGGYGRPGLNMLATGFSPFYIGGIRFSWNISSFYTRKNNLDNIQLNKEMVHVAKETFLFNNNLKINQQNTEIEKMRALLQTDDDILQLRTNIKKACSAKVDNGVSTITDLLREINAESIARQQKVLHEIQLLLQIQNLKYSTNN